MAGDQALTLKDGLQLAVSAVVPFIAAIGALWIASLQRKDRVSCFISYAYGHGNEELSMIGVHNRSSQPVAITAVRYKSGVIWRKPSEGTALDYYDPTDLGFPYEVAPGAIMKLRLDESKAATLAAAVGPIRRFIARVFRRSRLVVECQTTTGARFRTSAEKALPWDDQVPWKRG